MLRKTSQLTNRWKEVIDDLQLKQDLIKLLMHIRDATVLPQLLAVVPGGYTLVKLNVSGDSSPMAAAYTLHLLSVHMANENKKNSTLALASQKLCSFSIPVHELLGMWQGLEHSDEYICSIPAI